MKKQFIAGALALSLMLTACGGQTAQSSNAQQPGAQSSGTQQSGVQSGVQSSNTQQSGASTNNNQQGQKKAIVLYFNYSDNIDTTGLNADAISSASLHGSANGNAENLKLMAEEIAAKKNADVFSIRVNEVYPADFNDLAPKAREDVTNGKTFTFKEMPQNLASYDVVYVGAPIWWYELPQVMKVFIKQVDLSGKTVVPFGIHRGSGFNGIIDEYKKAWPAATVVDGFTISADTKNSEVKKSFDEFLDGIKY